MPRRLPGRRRRTRARPLAWGSSSGLLPSSHLTEESAIQVNLSNETVRLPLYPGIAYKGTPQAGEGLVRPAGRLRLRAGA